jgi:hypothetical protein
MEEDFEHWSSESKIDVKRVVALDARLRVRRAG